jgi:pyrimidine-nucleoside phosphorylase
MRAVDVIRKKRDGLPLSPAELRAVAAAATTGAWPDYQLSALLMAIVLRGLSPEETAGLTAAMADSGERLDWSDLPAPAVDKHSTGGVGDTTSLVLVPLAAVCGVAVPMISGRGLGHSGGTLDKLEAIPGFRTRLTLDEFRAAVLRRGAAIVGATDRIAPADRKLYELRDVTATVESVPLITASILSKKLAAGPAALVLDVKVGDGAFMKAPADARRLAESLVRVAAAEGLRAEALITDMDQPLGFAVGSALEVAESVATLRGEGPADLEALSVALAARMLRQGGVTDTDAAAEARVRDALTSGRGLEKFREIIEEQGGDPRVIDDPSRLPAAPLRRTLTANRSGFVDRLEAEPVGWAAMLLGAGRETAADVIDPSAGVLLRAKRGDRVAVGDALAELHGRDEDRLTAAAEVVRAAYVIADEPPAPPPLIRETIPGGE